MKFGAALAIKRLAATAAACLSLAQPIPARAAGSPVSLLSFNVHGLPWPLTSGRREAFARIEQRLIAMRHEGIQPHIVVLQEAFTTDAKQIGPKSGYRYVVEGPGRNFRTQVRPSPADQRFATGASFWRGESGIKLEDSGLQILSDYPVLSVREAAFPAFACAGYDCLANKGVLLATVAVPGLPTPVTIVTAHLNSRGASGASNLRSFQAFRRQIAIMDRFIRANHDLAQPMIVAGDFNPSGPVRRAYLMRYFATNWTASPNLPARDALTECFTRTTACNPQAISVDRWLLTHEKDKQFLIGGIATHLVTAGIAVPFLRESDGSMLSDHIGYSVAYGWSRSLPTQRLVRS